MPGKYAELSVEEIEYDDGGMSHTGAIIFGAAIGVMAACYFGVPGLIIETKKTIVPFVLSVALLGGVGGWLGHEDWVSNHQKTQK